MPTEGQNRPAPAASVPPTPLDLRGVRELLHDALHELAAINTLAAAVEADESCSDQAVFRLRRIQEQTVAVADMLREVFLSRLEAGPVDVRRVLEEIALSSGEGVRVAVRIAGAAPRFVLTNELRLRRVVRNLVDNAVRAAQPSGLVELSLTTTGDELVIGVDDSGPGFGKAPHGLASLGMQIVMRLVQESGGTVEVGDSHLGGARVAIALPSVMLVEAGIGRADAAAEGAAVEERTS